MVNAYIAQGTNPGAGMLEAARAKRNAFVQDRDFQAQQDYRNASMQSQQERAEAEHARGVMEQVMRARTPEQARALYEFGMQDAQRRGFDVSDAPAWEQIQGAYVAPPVETPKAPELVETVGPDGQPVYTPKSEAAGMQPYKAPQKPPTRKVVQVAGPDGKPRFEFEDIAVEQGLSPYMEPKEPKGIPTPADVAAQEAEAEAFRTMLTSANFADSVGPWDNLSAGFFGLFATEDKLMNREVGLAANEMILSAAKNLKGNLSDKDVRFLQDSMPKPSDREEIWYRWYNKTFLRKVNAARKTLDLPPIAPLEESGSYESQVQSLVDKYADKG